MANPNSHKHNTWRYIDARNLAQVVHRCLQTDSRGFQVFNTVNDPIIADQPTAASLVRWRPDAKQTRKMVGNETPLFNLKARELPEFREQYDWRKEPF